MIVEEFEFQSHIPAAFMPLLGGQRYQGAKGGRGGAKSHGLGTISVREMFTQHTRLACVREVQNSIKDSVKQLIEDKINTINVIDKATGKEWPIAPWFKITEREIVCKHNDSLAIFRGLQNHTATSIKSLEGFNRAWYEEAQSLTQRSIELATPTFRTPGSQQRFSWNPDLETDPVDVFFRENKDDPNFVCIRVNYYDNPWFPEDLRVDMERDKRRDPDKYGHVWLGGYRQNSAAQVFRNWKVESFETPANAQFYYGADWGFSVDPSVLKRCYIVGRTLYIDQEVYAVGCDIDHTPFLFAGFQDPEILRLNAQSLETAKRQPWAQGGNWKGIPGCQRAVITADSARPETISYMRKHGFPQIRSAIKGAGSVEDGIEFLKGYDVVIHPRCTHSITEWKLYSYKVDKKTGKVTTELEDKDNHTIDADRYALEGVRRAPPTVSVGTYQGHR